MRRLLSMLLLVAFSLPGFTPLFALSTSAQKELPACCRRAGMHHCMGTDADGQVAGEHRFSAPLDHCPYSPSTAATGAHSTLFLPAPDVVGISSLARPNGIAQTESKLRIARSRSRQKRGPPSLTSL